MNGETFREVKEDRSATKQSVAVVVLMGLSLATGEALATIGTTLYTSLIVAILSFTIALIASTAWAGVIYLIGTRVFKGPTGFWGIARPLFFSFTPGLLLVLVSVPNFFLRVAVLSIIAAWVMVADVLAVKNIMGLTIAKSMLTIILSTWVLILASSLLGF